VLSRHGHQQLIVLAARRRQLQCLVAAPGDLGDTIGDRQQAEVDVEVPLARPRQVTGVGAEPVADVNHRRRSCLGQRAALTEARRRVELPAQ